MGSSDKGGRIIWINYSYVQNCQTSKVITTKWLETLFKAEQRHLPCSHVSTESQGLTDDLCLHSSIHLNMAELFIPPWQSSDVVNITSFVLTNPGSTSLSSSLFSSQQHLTLDYLLFFPWLWNLNRVQTSVSLSVLSRLGPKLPLARA